MTGLSRWLGSQLLAGVGAVFGRYAKWCPWCPQFGRWPRLTGGATVPHSSGMCPACNAELRREAELPAVDVRR